MLWIGSRCESALLDSSALPHSELTRADLPSLQFTEKARFASSGYPYGQVVVLSSSTISVPTHNPARVEIWDWKECKQVSILTGLSKQYALGCALLPNGRFVVGDDSGHVRVGSLSGWHGAKAFRAGPGITGVLAGQDGSFLTTDVGGNIRLWRNGATEVSLTGCSRNWGVVGRTMVFAGQRLVVIGDASNLLVAE